MTDENKEFRDDIRDIREWLVRIDTKIEAFSDVKKKVDEAGNTANEALRLSQQNKEDIKELKDDKKSNISLWISGLSLLVLILFNILQFTK